SSRLPRDLRMVVLGLDQEPRRADPGLRQAGLLRVWFVIDPRARARERVLMPPRRVAEVGRAVPHTVLVRMAAQEILRVRLPGREGPHIVDRGAGLLAAAKAVMDHALDDDAVVAGIGTGAVRAERVPQNGRSPAVGIGPAEQSGELGHKIQADLTFDPLL